MTKKAYSVTDPDPYEAGSCIVFANTDIEARKRGADVLNLDEIGGLKCKREPWADQYEAENKIPATEMLAHGWALMCRGCEQLMEDGGYVTRYGDDGEETEIDINPTGTQHYCFCTPECEASEREYRARCKRGERRFLAALIREAHRKFPGIAIQESGHHCYFDHHSKSNRCRAICFVVDFTFPGSKYRASYRYDLGYEATKGKRSLLVANGDKDAWVAFRAVATAETAFAANL
jgi:hypothetical protein